jgi:uncharacterized coiled-coil DUF342 family protein
VKRNITEIWPTFRKIAPQMPLYNATTKPKEWIKLVQQAWEVLTDQAKDLQTQLEGMKLRVKAHPRELQHQIQRFVLEGNDARDLLHKNIAKCTTIFKEVSEWIGVITHCNQELEELRTKIQTLNE